MTWRGGDGQRGGVAGAESALPEGRALQLVTPAGEAHGPPVDEGGGGVAMVVVIAAEHVKK